MSGVREHHALCHVSQSWRGKSPRTFETIVELIGRTRTAAGLRVKAKLDKRKYLTGATTGKSAFHGDWNYQPRPRDYPDC